MAGPTSISVVKNGRASDATIANNSTGGVTASGLKVIIDSDNMDRGEAVRALESVKEVLLEGKYPPF